MKAAAWVCLLTLPCWCGVLSCATPASSALGTQAPASVGAAPQAATSVPSPIHSAKTVNPNEVIFSGMCDASGAVTLSSTRLVVADDEDNVLRVYDVTRGGAPLSAVELSPALRLSQTGKPGKQRYPETDIEAAASIGSRAYFLTSHGRNSSGKRKAERFQFFATEVQGEKLHPVGEPYAHLLDDLLAEPRLAAFGLREAAELAPKAAGGLNLEGMTARTEGGVWIGFRNPQPRGQALLIPLLNPEALIAKQPAQFGDPVTLDLGGRGVRALSAFRGEYLIAAGHYDSGGQPEVFLWDGDARVRPLTGVDLSAYNPEAFFTPEDASRILLLSDDGSVLVGDTECKRLKDPAQKHFRALWVTLPKAP